MQLNYDKITAVYQPVLGIVGDPIIYSSRTMCIGLAAIGYTQGKRSLKPYTSVQKICSKRQWSRLGYIYLRRRF